MLARLAIGAAAAFVLALGAFGLLARDGEPAPAALSAARLPELPPPSASTDRRIAVLQAIVRARPRLEQARVMLAAAYAQKARESGDVQFFDKAGGLLEQALQRDPADPAALTERAALSLSRHDFRAGLRDARAARRASPELNRPFGVLVDALVELGRYRAAGHALQAMVDRKPDVAAYSRVSYWRELHGDLAGAADAMRLAVAAGAGAAENVAAVQVLHGDLEAARGRPARAARDYAEALAGVPGFLPARAGRARLAAARGDLRAAIATMRRVVARLPLPEHVIALGELELAAGRLAAARRTFALVGAQQRLLAGAGVDTDAELAVFEASHGSPRRAVALGRRAWAAAPGIRSADALGWALTRGGRRREGLAWAHRALRLGSLDPLLRFHAGIAARGDERRRHLRLALAHGLAGHPWQAAFAREALR